VKKVIDLSNYDADHDMAYSPMWAVQFIGAGVDGIIVGSQWPDKARWQIARANAASLPVYGTYAEPDVASAVALALSCGARYVGLACEAGSITSRDELGAGVDYVRSHGLIPLIYANEGDYRNIAGPEFDNELRWLANYGANDPTMPRAPIQGVAVHQYSSTIQIADRVRDHNYWMIPEEEMSQEDKDKIEMLGRVVAGWGFTSDEGEMLSGWRAIQYLDEKQRSEYEGLRLTQEQLGAHIADKAAHR